MSPLLFLAIAIVVPLLGMVVLGVGARIKHQKATDDETGLFRRKLESIAPPDSQEPPSGTPGLDSEASSGADPNVDAGAATGAAAAGAAAGAAAAGADASVQEPPPSAPARKPPTRAPASVRLVERDYSVPLLPPLSADLEELPLQAGERRSRRAMPRPPEAERRHDRVISANQRPSQRLNQRPNQLSNQRPNDRSNQRPSQRPNQLADQLSNQRPNDRSNQRPNDRSDQRRRPGS